MRPKNQVWKRKFCAKKKCFLARKEMSRWSFDIKMLMREITKARSKLSKWLGPENKNGFKTVGEEGRLIIIWNKHKRCFKLVRKWFARTQTFGSEIKANKIMFYTFVWLNVYLVLNTLLLLFLNLLNKMVLNLGTKLCFLDKYKEVWRWWYSVLVDVCK